MASPKRRILKANSLETQRSSARLICTAWNPFSNMFRSFKEPWNEVMTGRYSSCFTEVQNLQWSARARSARAKRAEKRELEWNQVSIEVGELSAAGESTVSGRTVKRDWRIAKAWLYRELLQSDRSAVNR